jgi:hypothetical protein
MLRDVKLRDLPVDLPLPGKDVRDEVAESESASRSRAALLLPIQLSTAPELLHLHPEPRHIFKLWQAFADKINPLSKIIHAPTLQQRICDVCWNLEGVAKPLEAVMFSIYALAVSSLKHADCVQVFGESKAVLLNRYRSAAALALVGLEIHSTRNLEVLQALILYLVHPTFIRRASPRPFVSNPRAVIRPPL